MNPLNDKPWMRPIMYSNDVDPSHGQQGGQVNKVREMVDGEAVVVEGRDHYSPNEFGDGRPAGMPDNTPMVYRQPTATPLIDIDDHDELDTTPQEYVPAPRLRNEHGTALSPTIPTPTPLCNVALPTNTVQYPQMIGLVDRNTANPMPCVLPFTLKLMEIASPLDKETTITIAVGRDTYVLTPVELNQAIVKLSAWAEAVASLGNFGN